MVPISQQVGAIDWSFRAHDVRLYRMASLHSVRPLKLTCAEGLKLTSPRYQHITAIPWVIMLWHLPALRSIPMPQWLAPSRTWTGPHLIQGLFSLTREATGFRLSFLPRMTSSTFTLTGIGGKVPLFLVPRIYHHPTWARTRASPPNPLAVCHPPRLASQQQEKDNTIPVSRMVEYARSLRRDSHLLTWLKPSKPTECPEL